MNDQMLEDILRRLNRLRQTSARVRVGEVTGTNPLDVALGGADTSYENVKAVGAVAAGDQVATLLWGNDLLVLGTIGDGGAHAVALPFAAGWASGVTGAATYSRIGRLVILRGGVTKTGGVPAGADQIAVLPAGFRPPISLLFSVVTGPSANTFGVVRVTSAGSVDWITGSATETDFTDLSSVSFVVD